MQAEIRSQAKTWVEPRPAGGHKVPAQFRVIGGVANWEGKPGAKLKCDVLQIFLGAQARREQQSESRGENDRLNLELELHRVLEDEAQAQETLSGKFPIKAKETAGGAALYINGV